jgi:hypothetical protein
MIFFWSAGERIIGSYLLQAIFFDLISDCISC